MGFMGYELACDQAVQQRLYDEILATQEELNGQPLTYEKLQNMKYLDQVVSEVLRKWPPAAISDRICVKNYQFEDDDKKFVIEKDISFMIPIWALHQ